MYPTYLRASSARSEKPSGIIESYAKDLFGVCSRSELMRSPSPPAQPRTFSLTRSTNLEQKIGSQLPASLRVSTERLCALRISGHLRHGPKRSEGIVEPFSVDPIGQMFKIRTHEVIISSSWPSTFSQARLQNLEKRRRKHGKIRAAWVSLPAASVAS